jgi:hypothetical protein
MKAIHVARKAAQRTVIAYHIGDQDNGRGGKISLWNLAVDVPGHPAGSTVSGETLKRIMEERSNGR